MTDIVDFVLVYEKGNDNAIFQPAKKYKESISGELEEAIEDFLVHKSNLNLGHIRDTFLKRLKDTYRLEIQEKISQRWMKHDYVFQLIRVPFDVLEHYAERLQINKKIRVNANHDNFEAEIKSLLHGIQKRTTSSPSKGLFRPNSTESINQPKNVLERIFGNNRPVFTTVYRKEIRDLFDLGLDKEHFFTSAERARICSYILNECSFADEPIRSPNDFGLERLVSEGVFTRAYPLHRRQEVEEIKDRWLGWRNTLPWGRRPYHPIFNYFGDKVALYFSWISFYSAFLVPLAFSGLGVYVYGLLTASTDPVLCQYKASSTTSKLDMCPPCDEKDCGIYALGEEYRPRLFAYKLHNSASIAYALVLAFWTIVLHRWWARRELKLHYDWNLTDRTLEHEVVRPQYRAKAKQLGTHKRFNPTTLKSEYYIPAHHKYLGKIMNIVAVITFILLILSLIFVAYTVYEAAVIRKLGNHVGFNRLVKWVKDGSSNGDYLAYAVNLVIPLNKYWVATTTSNIILGIGAAILNAVYKFVAVKLTNLEWHRTHKQYEESLLTKMFWFNFADLYGPVFFVAFVKGMWSGVPGNYGTVFNIKVGNEVLRWLDCYKGGCIYELTSSLLVFFTVTTILNSMINRYLLPFIGLKIREEHLEERSLRENPQRALRTQLKPWERDFILPPADPMVLFFEWQRISTQYGFTVLFSVAFPLAPLLIILYNLFAIQSDVFKLTDKQQRVVSEKVDGIHVWVGILDMVGKFSITVNSLILTFTSDIFSRWFYKHTGDGTLSNFVRDSMSSFDVKCFDKHEYNLTSPTTGKDVGECFYYGKRVRHGTGCESYKYTDSYYRLMLYKTMFVIIVTLFFHFMEKVIDMWLPMLPQKLKNDIKIEQTITKSIMENRRIRTGIKQEPSKILRRSNIDGERNRISTAPLPLDHRTPMAPETVDTRMHLDLEV